LIHRWLSIRRVMPLQSPRASFHGSLGTWTSRPYRGLIFTRAITCSCGGGSAPTSTTAWSYVLAVAIPRASTKASIVAASCISGRHRATRPGGSNSCPQRPSRPGRSCTEFTTTKTTGSVSLSVQVLARPKRLTPGQSRPSGRSACWNPEAVPALAAQPPQRTRSNTTLFGRTASSWHDGASLAMLLAFIAFAPRRPIHPCRRARAG